MKSWFFVIGIWWLFAVSPARAVFSPSSVPNNRIGVHILDPQEIDSAAKLVNSAGGDWGYVTIPMRSNDRDRDKWIKFFTSAHRLHVIPIIRLATYPDGAVWVRPTVYDLVDFANFLSDMPWPVQNRYVILFNEVNHASEWGGEIDPFSYATLLLDAKNIFKGRSSDFFLISAGLDMSAPRSTTSMDALDFYKTISRLQPQWYHSVDGLSSHAYPNPAFSASPFSNSRYGIASFEYELSLFRSLGYPAKPLFITETGWANQPDNYTPAFNYVWANPRIVAVTPFLLFAGAGPFAKFSLLNSLGYQGLQNLPKIAGSPLLANITFLPAVPSYASPPSSQSSPLVGFTQFLTHLFKKSVSTHPLTIGATTLAVELADTSGLRHRGLSGRAGLPDRTGMLFVFPVPGRYSFWMQDMRFALDFIWINNHSVVQISPTILPPSHNAGQIITLTPDQPVDRVLEVPAGFVAQYGIKVSDKVKGGD